MFSGVINPSISRVKDLQPAEYSNGKARPNKIKAKAAVAVRDGSGKFEVEHCEISFMTENDRRDFIASFN